jgi:multicomponent K+:H+ antiporter subunit G
MQFAIELLVSALIVIGTFFVLVGSIGLAKLPDMMRRLHAPTKSTTLGIGSFLIASMVYFTAIEGVPSIHELLITLFLFLTAPITAYMLSKAHLLRDGETQRDARRAGGELRWATLDRPEGTEKIAPRDRFPAGESVERNND